MNPGVIVIGGGQGGFQVAASLREMQFSGSIDVVGDEPHLPYGRPPLSKNYLTGEAGIDRVQLRPATFYDDNSIVLRLGDAAVKIDRHSKTVTLASGTVLEYSHLVLATGARARTIDIPGADLGRVVTLRSLADSDAFRDALSRPGNVVVIGGGFIGLECAAAATKAGHTVTVVEGLDRIMKRAVAPEVSAFMTEVHRVAGTTVLLGRGVAAIHDTAGQATAVQLDDGTSLAADLVIVGVGVTVNTELAADAGLTLAPPQNGGGIQVDAQLLTSDPFISAIGDCANYPSAHAGCAVRLESVQNATDQARFVASRIVGPETMPGGYTSVPWFWTHQHDAKVQMAGLGAGEDTRIVVGDAGAFSVFRFDGDRLTSVESVNKSKDHIAARKALTKNLLPTPAEVTVDGFDLKEFVAGQA